MGLFFFFFNTKIWSHLLSFILFFIGLVIKRNSVNGAYLSLVIFLQVLLKIWHLQLTLQLDMLQLGSIVLCFSNPEAAVCCNVEEFTLLRFLATPITSARILKHLPQVSFKLPFSKKDSGNFLPYQFPSKSFLLLPHKK